MRSLPNFSFNSTAAAGSWPGAHADLTLKRTRLR
jgi:hypothetical protein